MNRGLRHAALPAGLLAACTTSSPAGSGALHDVHVILRLDPPPAEAMAARPVVKAGGRTFRCPPQRLDSRVAAAEIAVFGLPSGEHSFELRLRERLFRLTGPLEITGETWVVLTLAPGGQKSIGVHRSNPVESAGPWRPFASVPD